MRKFIISLLALLSLGAIERKPIDYELYFSPEIRAAYPNAAPVALNFTDLKDAPQNPAANQCYKRNADNTASIWGQCGGGGGGGSVNLTSEESDILRILGTFVLTANTQFSESNVWKDSGIQIPDDVDWLFVVIEGINYYDPPNWISVESFDALTAERSASDSATTLGTDFIGLGRFSQSGFVQSWSGGKLGRLNSVEKRILLTRSGTGGSPRTVKIYGLLSEAVSSVSASGGGGGGGGSFDFSAALANPQDQWLFPLQQRAHAPASLFNFTTAACPSGWGSICWSIEPNAVRGSVSPVAPNADIVLLSNSSIAYDANATKRVRNVWIGTTEYSVSSITDNYTLGNRNALYSQISPHLPGSNWQAVKFEFTDGTFSPAEGSAGALRTADKATLIKFLDIEEFSPSTANIYPAIKDSLKAGANISITASDSAHSLTLAASAPESHSPNSIIALDTEPTDLSSYPDNSVLRINNPSPGKWLEVEQQTEWGHGLKASVATSGRLNGFSIVGTTQYGSVTTEEGDSFSNNPVGRIEYDDDPDSAGQDSITVLIRKEALSSSDQALSAIYMRVYSGAPSNLTDLSTANLSKGTDLTIDNIVYQTYSSNVNQSAVNSFKGWMTSYSNTLYFRFFTMDTADTAEGQNASPLDFYEEKIKKEIDIQGTQETGQTIKEKLEELSGNARLSVLSLKDRLSASLPDWLSDVVGEQETIITGSNEITELSPSFNPNTAASSGNLSGGADSGIMVSGNNDSSLKFQRYTITNNRVSITDLTHSFSTAIGQPRRRNFSITPSIIGDQDSGFIILYGIGTQSSSAVYKYSVSSNNVNLFYVGPAGSHGLTGRYSYTEFGTKNNPFFVQSVSGRNQRFRIKTFTNTDIVNSREIHYRINPSSFSPSLIRFSGQVPSGIAVVTTSSNVNYYRYQISGQTITFTLLTKQNDIAISETLYLTFIIGDLSSGIIFRNDRKILEYSVTNNNISFNQITLSQNLNAFYLCEPKGTAESGLYCNAASSDSTKNALFRYQFGDRIETNGVIKASTPRQLSRLPEESDSNEGGEVFIPEDYTLEKGVNITPQSFAGTELDASQAGERGYFNPDDDGFDLGQIHPKLPDNFVLISNIRVYVKRNTLTNLAKLHLGDTEYALTRVPQAAGTKILNSPDIAPGEPDIDYYTITGGLPAGDWDDLRFETTTSGTFIPASPKLTKGLYEFLNNDWQRDDFYAPKVNPSDAFKIPVETETAEGKTDKNLALSADGSDFSIENPFEGISKLKFNASAGDLQYRYSVEIPLAGFEDDKAPAVLEVGTKKFPLSYFETDAGLGIYRTNQLVSADRVTAAGTINSVNIQAQDLSWYGHSGLIRNLRTLDSSQLLSIAGKASIAHNLPSNPLSGQEFQPLADINVANPSILTVGEDSSHATWGWFGTQGDSAPKPTEIVGLLAYSSATSNNINIRNRLAVVRASGNTKTPSALVLNGKEYTLSATPSLPHSFRAAAGTSHLIAAGKKYSWNVKYSDGSKLFADVMLGAGQEYVWDGYKWLRTSGETREGIEAIVREGVADWAENGNADTIPISKICGGAPITLAAYNALSPKQADRIYCVLKPTSN